MFVLYFYTPPFLRCALHTPPPNPCTYTLTHSLTHFCYFFSVTSALLTNCPSSLLPLLLRVTPPPLPPFAAAATAAAASVVQAFQFSLVGASEILAAITSLEFFYSQAPLSMRSVAQSLNLFTNALGSFLVIPLLLMVNADPSTYRTPCTAVVL
jgi:hypothetical protein